MPSPEVTAYKMLEDVAKGLGVPVPLIAAEKRELHRRIPGVFNAFYSFEADITAGKYTAAHAANERADAAIANAKPRPAPIVPVPEATALLARVIRHEPANAKIALALLLGALRSVMGKLQSLSWDGELTANHRLTLAAATGMIDTDDLATNIGPLPPIRPLTTKYTAWATAIANSTGVTATMSDDQKRRETITRMDVFVPALTRDRNYLGIYWVLEARRYLADGVLVEGHPDQVFASEAAIELVLRHRVDVADVSVTKPVIATTTRVRTKLVEKGG